MARIQRVGISFSRMTDDAFLVLVNTIIGAMKENINFPSPVPELEDIESLIDDFTTKLKAARKRGSPEDTALKNESRPILEEAMQQLGHYVNSIAKGQLSTLLSSGFGIVGNTAPALVPKQVESVKLSDGRQMGQVRLDFEKQQDTLIYEYTYRRASEMEEDWSDRLITTSSKGNIIAPLKSGSYYEVRVRAVNRMGAGDWSQVVKFLIR